MTISETTTHNNIQTNLPTSADKPLGKRVLAVFNVDIAKRRATMQERGADNFPHADFFGLIETLQAEAIDLGSVEKSFSGRLVKKVLGSSLALAWVAFRKSKNYDVIYSDGEPNGIPLAIMLKLARRKQKVFMIGHLITARKKVLLLKWLRLYKQIGVIFLHATHQYNTAINVWRIPAEKLALLPYQVDPTFWRADAVTPPSEKAYICSVGLEFRDYGTLIEAVKDLPVEVRIAAASHWSRRNDPALSGTLPPNVSVKSYNYTELRELYAGSQFVVVPLREVPFQAGITTILEAMAMGKAVVVTRTSGQNDVITDRRSAVRGRKTRPAIGNFAQMFGSASTGNKATGFYVNPAQVEELRQAIKYLLEHTEFAQTLGQNGREVLTETMTLEQFCQRIKSTLGQTPG